TITFDALREYVIGDELRKVHWRTSARVGQLMVREDLDTSLPRVVVLVDDRQAAYRDLTEDGGSADFEAVCEAAASVLVACVRADLAVELVVASGERPVGTGAHRAAGPGLARCRSATPRAAPFHPAPLRAWRLRGPRPAAFLHSPGLRRVRGYRGAGVWGGAGGGYGGWGGVVPPQKKEQTLEIARDG